LGSSDEAQLLHRYTFNDGTTGDSVGGSAYAGTLVSSATVSGGSLQLSTLGKYMNVPSTALGSYTSITIEAWATTTTSNAAWNCIFQWGTNPASNANSLKVCRTSFSGVFYIEWCSTTGTYYNSFSTVTFNGQTGIHIAAIFAVNGLPQLYLNGVLAGTFTQTLTAIPAPTYFRLGGTLDGSSTGTLLGSIDEFRIWGGALSASAIALSHQQGPGERIFNN
jgi:hypothetical protein